MTDAEFSENVNAIASLLGALRKSAPGEIGFSNERTSVSSTMEVRAYRVPIGFYESVVSRGPDGKKRLYAWRYVGFAPFNSCPAEYQGLECRDCGEPLYGLVRIGDTMVFSILDELATSPLSVQLSDAKGEPADQSGLDHVEAQLVKELTAAQLIVTPDRIHVRMEDEVVVVSATGIAPEKHMDFRVAVGAIVANAIPGRTSYVEFR